MKEKVTPLHDRVIIEPEKISNISKGGIIIPDTAKEKPLKGKVISCGTGKKDEPMTVKKGDFVLYERHAGSDIEVGDKKYLIMRELDILAII